MRREKITHHLRRKLLREVSESREIASYLDSVFIIFGPINEGHSDSSFSEVKRKLERFSLALELLNSSNAVADPDSSGIEGFKLLKKQLIQARARLRNSPLRIRCSGEELLRIADIIDEKGFVEFDKKQCDSRFDLSEVFPWWSFVPDYARVFVGCGIGFSFPDWDMFFSMCLFYNEAVHRETHSAPTHELPDAQPRSDVAVRFAYIRHVIVSACLFVEAFINGLAHNRRRKSGMKFTSEEELFLKERKRDKQGNERTGYVNLENKLCEWTRLISPRNSTFDKGGKVFQDFQKTIEFRDAIVHHSESKSAKYRAIKLETAKNCAVSAIAVAREICRHIASSEDDVVYPPWLKGPEPDGRFKLDVAFKPCLSSAEM